MILYSIKRYLFRNYKKIFISFIILCFLGVILNYLVQDEAKIATLWDYVFSSFSYPLATILIIPLMYFYLIGDIFISDYNEGNLEFYLLRYQSRLRYFISKILIIIITSNLFFFVYLGILIVIGIMLGFPLNGNYSCDVLQCNIEYGGNIVNLLCTQYILFTMLLNTIGICTLVISLLTSNTIYSNIGIILTIIHGRNTIFDNNDGMLYSLLSQGVLSYHNPFYFYKVKYNINSELLNFTVAYSIKYLYLIFIVFFIVGWYRIRTMDLTLKN